nr:ABC transporter substrate-binding protein [Bradyrhizobium sp. JYMT SZCCT0180]
MRHAEIAKKICTFSDEAAMRRRDFLNLAGGALVGGSTSALAQQVYRVAILTPSQTQWQPRTFRDALQEFGYREGVNLKIDVVSGENELGRLPKLAEGVVATGPDVIVAVNTPGTRAAMSATSIIPIVSAVVADPIFLGIVTNIAKPGGNVTGVANLGADITSKRIALLKEIVPSAERIALFMHPDEPITTLQIQDVERSSAALDIKSKAFPMRTLEDLQQGLQQAIQWKAHAVVRLAGQGFALGTETGRLATENNLPSMLLQRRDVEAGGLMSYFADHQELWRRIAAQVNRILKGTSPRELPFELPTRFELTVNLKVGKTLGLTVPPTLLARADEVIE